MSTYALMTPSYAPALSLHVPRIDTRDLGPQASDHDFVRQFVTHQFMLNGVGSVSRVDLLSKINQHGYQYYEAFVHFSTWYDNEFSLSLRRQACSPRLNARLGLLGTSHYWHVNESRSPVYEEDFQSILSSMPVALWQQAADETECWPHWNAQQEDAVLERWYSNPPTDQQLAAVALIERTWLRAHAPAPVLRKPAAKKKNKPWACDTCAREEIAGDPATEPYAGNTCGRCAQRHWDY